MTAFTDGFENEILQRYLKNTTAWTPVATTYLGLATAASDSSFTEIATGSYARYAATWGTVASGSVSLSGTHTFVTATANWGTIHNVGMFSAITSGNQYFWGQLTADVIINSGDTFEFATTAVSVTLN